MTEETSANKDLSFDLKQHLVKVLGILNGGANQ